MTASLFQVDADWLSGFAGVLADALAGRTAGLGGMIVGGITGAKRID
jgi:hypothetical protein